MKSCRIARWSPAESSVGTPPSALAVIVPNGYGHVRGGEVGVIPIGALGP
ncbi:MAG: hypothetical protein OXU74_09885 [Gemmatimonadota bacterium]|nr:hypothetical protein [Gemmatimonadota bacterium]